MRTDLYVPWNDVITISATLAAEIFFVVFDGFQAYLLSITKTEKRKDTDTRTASVSVCLSVDIMWK